MAFRQPNLAAALIVLEFFVMEGVGQMIKRDKAILEVMQSTRRLEREITTSGVRLWVMCDWNGTICEKEEWESIRDKVDLFYAEIGTENVVYVSPESATPEETPTAKPKHRPQPGYVYLWQADNGLYKIGWAKDPDARINKLGVVLPYSLEEIHRIKSDDAPVLEKRLHEIFDSQWVNGEWFDLSTEDVDSFVDIAEEENGS